MDKFSPILPNSGGLRISTIIFQFGLAADMNHMSTSPVITAC